MVSKLVSLTTWCLLVASWPATIVVSSENARISGLVVSGTDGRKPLAGAEVVLRVNGIEGFEAIATTTTDEQGRFEFSNLAINERVIYLPGANRHGVHFPGPRVRLDRKHLTADVELVAYDAVQAPSPLVVRRHDISVRVETGFMEISEALAIDNPSRTAYIGEAQEDRPSITLRLRLPAGFETVTFAEEFLGRSFLIHDNQLVTDLPWPPGKRDVKFVYRLPVEQRSGAFRRVLDLPTEKVTIRVAGQDPNRIACDLPRAKADRDGEVVFAQQTSTLAAGHVVELRMGDLPIRWEIYVRWGTLVVLAVLLVATLLRNRQRHRGLISASPNPRTRGTGRRERRSLPAGRSP
jgi:hypothetical protein